MKKFTFSLLLILGFLWATPAMAQNYKGAIGARLGVPLSVSAKYFVSETSALEGFVGFRGYSSYRWVTVGAAYQIHNPLEIENIEGLSWYYGVGVNAYFWTFKDNFLGVGESESDVTFGVAGYLGLDYAFPEKPFNLTIDWVPTYFFNGFANGFGGGYGSIGVRYIFAR